MACKGSSLCEHGRLKKRCKPCGGSELCKHADCTKRSGFNFDNEKQGVYCAEHKLDGMVNVVDRRCKHSDCMKRPGFNFEGLSGF
jgi:hypothetical protein